MDEIRLYAFRPDGHGSWSFFVAETSIERARASVTEYARRMSAQGYRYECREWLESPDDYTMSIHPCGAVVSNNND